MTDPVNDDVPLRPHAEEAHAAELAALAALDDRPRPPRWRLSPHAVVTFLLGGVLADGTVVSPKYVGNRRHRRGVDPVRLELRPAARRGAQ